MKTQFTARHFKPHDALRDFALAEVERLDRFFEGILHADVVLAEDNQTTHVVRSAEIVLTLSKARLATKETADDFMKAVTAAVEKMERQLKKYKEKHHVEPHRGKNSLGELSAEAPAAPEE
jgi:ribosomal subunit interface protein